MMNTRFALLCTLTLVAGTGMNNPSTDSPTHVDLADRNLQRAMELADSAFAHYFTGDGMAMARFYNPSTGIRSEEKGSVWMYTAAIEATNAILHALQAHDVRKKPHRYELHSKRYRDRLAQLYDNLAYYRGTFELTSLDRKRTRL